MNAEIKSGKTSGKFILFLSVISLLLGSAAILLFNEIGEGAFLLVFAFLFLVIFYYRLSGINGSGYENYREPLDIALLIGFDIVAIVSFLIHPNELALIVSVFLICITNLVLVTKMYKKHFTKITKIPGISQLE